MTPPTTGPEKLSFFGQVSLLVLAKQEFPTSFSTRLGHSFCRLYRCECWIDGDKMTSEVASPLASGVSSWLPLSGEQRWYVVRTLPQRERHAVRQLTNQGYRVFLPLHLKTRRHARKVETVSAPLFPRYLFTVVDRTQDRWRSINGTLGVERLLMSGGEPQPVPRGLVESLIVAADDDGTVHFDFSLHEGQSVKVIAGPFADLIGRLERLDDRGRVSVLLELMGGSVRVALPRTFLEPTSGAA
jgi:transcription elongation factor/antiterminator RfaH